MPAFIGLFLFPIFEESVRGADREEMKLNLFNSHQEKYEIVLLLFILLATKQQRRECVVVVFVDGQRK